MRSDKNKKRRSLGEKVSAKVASRQGGGNFSSYLLLPDGVELFKPKKEGNYRFNIIPYVAGKNNRDTEPGELDYEFTFWVHRVGEGDEQKTIICPKKTYGKRCPICEQVERLSKNYIENEDEIKAIKAKQRQIFNIVDVRDEENKIQIYETSYFKGFGEMLDKRLRNFDDEDDENYGDFADIPGGRTLKVAYTEDTFNGNKFFAPSSIDFVARKEELPDSIIDEAVCLDSCLKVLDYDAILKMIAGTDDDEEEVEEEHVEVKRRPRRGESVTSKKVEEPEEDEDEESDEEEETPPERPTRKSRRSEPVEEDDDEDADEETDDDEDEEEETPKSRRGTTRREKSVAKKDDDDDDDEDEDDVEDQEEKPDTSPKKRSAKKVEPEDDEDDEDDEEEEKPAPKSKKSPKKEEKKSSKKGGKCPHGYSWGADCYVYSECDTCDLCEECDAAQED